MFAYNPEKFASLYETELGRRIWAFITEAENIARLETASQLGKPAVEGIEEQLLDEFREDVPGRPGSSKWSATWFAKFWNSATGYSIRPT